MIVFRYLVQAFFSRLRRLGYNLRPGITIGRGTIIERGAVIRCQYGGSITIAENCLVSRGAMLLTHGGNISIGKDCTVNPYAVLYGGGGLTIGRAVRIAAHCTIVPANHIYKDPDRYIYLQGRSMEGIVIEDDVWLGSGVTVLDGVVIKYGCVIGAGSIVTKSTESYGVYVGVPAHKINSRKQ